MSDSKHIVCPHCQATNRIPDARLVDKPNCGKCHKALFTAQPFEVSGSNFQKHISQNHIPVVVDFWAPWCGPCKSMAPAYAQACTQLEPNFRLIKLNTENEQAIAGQFRIQSIPTIAIFKNGKEVSRQAGAMGASDIVTWINNA